MLDAVPYDALLVLHLLGVTGFLAGLILTVSILPGLMRRPPSDERTAGLMRVRLIQRGMTTPALVLLWACGIGMTLEAGWYLMDWLRLKVACVLVLTLLHASNVRRIRALLRGDAVAPAGYRILWLILALVIVIGILVIGKPF